MKNILKIEYRPRDYEVSFYTNSETAKRMQENNNKGYKFLRLESGYYRVIRKLTPKEVEIVEKVFK
jgi:hypothetical protein